MTQFLIPTLTTERLILRAPRMADARFYTAFKTSDRAGFTGGPTDTRRALLLFSAITGQWVLRGYGLFMATTRDDPDTVIGGFGVFHPQHQVEPEFGWTLYDGAYEGQGFVTEAMRSVIPWAWPVMGVTTAQSHIDEGNDASVAVAKRLGATFDAAETNIANAPGGAFYTPSTDKPVAPVNIWRHHKGAMT